MKAGNELEAGKPGQSEERSNKRAGTEPRPKGPAQLQEVEAWSQEKKGAGRKARGHLGQNPKPA